MSKVLQLTIKKEWFDMIASGEKKEEYRDIKQYWKNRLVLRQYPIKFLNIESIKFYNGGYCSDSLPHFTIKCEGIEQRTGKPEWGASPGKSYYVIKLGEIIK